MLKVTKAQDPADRGGCSHHWSAAAASVVIEVTLSLDHDSAIFEGAAK
jgi:hypothetical protein